MNEDNILNEGRILGLSQDLGNKPVPLSSRPPVSDALPTIAYITSEMVSNLAGENGQAIKALLSDLGEIAQIPAVGLPVVFARFWRACEMWRDLVSYGRRWDHKAAIKEQSGVQSTFAGALISFDVWSNIHYGYVGVGVGFPKFVLLEGAGYAQYMKTGPVPGWTSRILQSGLFTSLDDPRDVEAIRVGFALYDEVGTDLDVEKFVRVLRRSIQKIAD